VSWFVTAVLWQAPQVTPGVWLQATPAAVTDTAVSFADPHVPSSAAADLFGLFDRDHSALGRENMQAHHWLSVVEMHAFVPVPAHLHQMMPAGWPLAWE